MSAVLERIDPRVALARARAAVTEMQAADLSGLTDEQLLEYGRDKERLARQLSAADHPFVTELDERDLPERHKLGLAAFLRGLLRLDPQEAAGRVKAARAAGPRQSLTGQPLPPIFDHVAAAQAAGNISERHARVVVHAVQKLPAWVRAEQGAAVEAQLVEYANQFDPQQLAKIARRINYCYDQDGSFDPDGEHRAQQRGLTVQQRPDGSSTIRGEATAELAEFLLTSFDALGKPRPAIDGVKDPRTAAQRRHDAVLEALKINVRARALPSIAGVTATIVLTMTAEDFEQRKGLARSAHGALIPVPDALKMTAGEYRLMNVVIDKTKGITAYSDTARLFTENQRLARAAIDGGCTFPDCPAPPGWCEMDHVLDWARGGRTRVDVAGLACHPHNEAKNHGWRTEMINGRVGWIPPPWIDPEQKPRFNHLHDTQPPETAQ
jgi:hypothetical protein